MPTLSFWLLVALLLPAHGPVAGSHRLKPRPSVLFVLSDDLGYANLGYHQPFVQTPHIDRIARAGIRLESYYVQPICSPTRSSLMTGRYTYRLGTQAEIIETYVPFGVPLRERFLPQLFQAAGYRTACYGKWVSTTLYLRLIRTNFSEPLHHLPFLR